MAQAMREIVRFALLLVALLAFPGSSVAHRLDEYLQATIVAIEPGDIRLHINLTPGVAVAEPVLAMIDRNRDGAISTNEATAYGEALKRDLRLRLDGRELKLKITASEFTTPAELRAGWGVIQMEFSASPRRFRDGAHTLAFENRHQTERSVYLFNAAQPGTGLVRITRQKRNANQSTGEIEFTFGVAPDSEQSCR